MRLVAATWTVSIFFVQRHMCADMIDRKIVDAVRRDREAVWIVIDRCDVARDLACSYGYAHLLTAISAHLEYSTTSSVCAIHQSNNLFCDRRRTHCARAFKCHSIRANLRFTCLLVTSLFILFHLHNPRQTTAKPLR